MTYREKIQAIINKAFVGKRLNIIVTDGNNLSHRRTYIIDTANFTGNNVVFNKREARGCDILAIKDALTLADKGTYYFFAGFGARISYALKRETEQ